MFSASRERRDKEKKKKISFDIEARLKYSGETS
jgi:hypothetical protein